MSTMPSATSAKAALGVLGGDRAGQDPRADQEQAFLAEQPQAIEEFLVGIGVLQGRGKPRRQFALVRHRAEEARIDQSVHDLRLPRQHVAEPGCGAENQRHQRDQIAVLARAARSAGRRAATPAGSGRRRPPRCRAPRHAQARRSARERTRQRRSASASDRAARDSRRPSSAARSRATMIGFLKPSAARCSIRRGSSAPAL